MAFKVVKYSLSADLKYALFAYDVKQVSFKLKSIFKPEHLNINDHKTFWFSTTRAVIGVVDHPQNYQPSVLPFVYFLTGCYLHRSPVQHPRGLPLTYLHAQTNTHISSVRVSSGLWCACFYFCSFVLWRALCCSLFLKIGIDLNWKD